MSLLGVTKENNTHGANSDSSSQNNVNTATNIKVQENGNNR